MLKRSYIDKKFIYVYTSINIVGISMVEIIQDARKFLQKLQRRTIRNFLDILILLILHERPMSGYDIITLIFERFGVFLSAGSVYSMLHVLEREKLIRGYWDGRRRIYILTEKGEALAEITPTLSDTIQNLVLSILKIRRAEPIEAINTWHLN